jgi:hypothetical protein
MLNLRQNIERILNPGYVLPFMKVILSPVICYVDIVGREGSQVLEARFYCGDCITV